MYRFSTTDRFLPVRKPRGPAQRPTRCVLKSSPGSGCQWPTRLAHFSSVRFMRQAGLSEFVVLGSTEASLLNCGAFWSEALPRWHERQERRVVTHLSVIRRVTGDLFSTDHIEAGKERWIVDLTRTLST